MTAENEHLIQRVMELVTLQTKSMDEEVEAQERQRLAAAREEERATAAENAS